MWNSLPADLRLETQFMGVATIERWERAHPHQRCKLPKLEHVALNSASETGAIMHQNAQICKLNFTNFLGAMPPDPHTVEGLRRLSPDHTPLSAPALRAYRASLGAFGLSIVPPIRNHGSTPGRTHPLKILATPMQFSAFKPQLRTVLFSR